MKQRCIEALERVYLYLDGEGLSEAERLEIETHLEECGPCFEEFGLHGEVKAIVARLKGTSPCPEALRSRISALLSQE